jgi:hypothetical protein
MEVRLGKWQKGDMQRIYFNSTLLGSVKVFAQADHNGDMEVKVQKKEGEYSANSYADDVMNEGVKAIEELVGKTTCSQIKDHATFADVWSAVN